MVTLELDHTKSEDHQSQQNRLLGEMNVCTQYRTTQRHFSLHRQSYTAATATIAIVTL